MFKLVSVRANEEIKEDKLGLEKKSLDDTCKAMEAKEGFQCTCAKLELPVTVKLSMFE